MAPTRRPTVTVPLDDLTEHPENDRTGPHDRAVRSLLLNGQYRPIIAQYGTGVILGGHRVYRAACDLATGVELDVSPDEDSDALRAAVEARREQGWPSNIDVDFIECTDDEARAILAADNHVADDSSYDPQASLALGLALEELGMLAAGGFADDQLDDLRAQLEEVSTPRDPTGVDDPSSKDTIADRADVYANHGTRSVVLFLGAEDYAKMIDRLSDLRRRYGVDSNTEVVMRLVNDAHTASEATA